MVSSLVNQLGPELDILERIPVDEIARTAPPLVAEAVNRVRQGAVLRDAGYDGEYGTISIFTPEELRTTPTTATLFEPDPVPLLGRRAPHPRSRARRTPTPEGGPRTGG